MPFTSLQKVRTYYNIKVKTIRNTSKDILRRAHTSNVVMQSQVDTHTTFKNIIMRRTTAVSSTFPPKRGMIYSTGQLALVLQNVKGYEGKGRV